MTALVYCQTSLGPLGKGHAFPGESGPVPCSGLPLTTHPPSWYLPSPSTFCDFCNLLKGGGYWLPVRPWINSHPLSFTHFVSTQQAGVSLAFRYFPFPSKFTVLNSLLPQQGEVGASVPHSTYISAGLGTGNGGGGQGTGHSFCGWGIAGLPRLGDPLLSFCLP